MSGYSQPPYVSTALPAPVEYSLAPKETVPAAAVADVAGVVPAGGVGAAAGGWDTAGNRDTAIATITETKTQLNDLLAKLRAAGLITP